MKLKVLIVLLAVAVVTPVLGVGTTTRIVFAGTDLGASVAVSNPGLVSRFNVWSGPGTALNGARATEGFVANWSAGAVVEPPRGLRRYEVSFYVTPRQTSRVPAGSAEELAYVIDYEGDESHGFVFIPGRADARYTLNTKSIYRGIEGQWFRATDEWHRFAVESLTQRSRQ